MKQCAEGAPGAFFASSLLGGSPATGQQFAPAELFFVLLQQIVIRIPINNVSIALQTGLW